MGRNKGLHHIFNSYFIFAKPHNRIVFVTKTYTHTRYTYKIFMGRSFFASPTPQIDGRFVGSLAGSK